MTIFGLYCFHSFIYVYIYQEKKLDIFVQNTHIGSVSTYTRLQYNVWKYILVFYWVRSIRSKLNVHWIITV